MLLVVITPIYMNISSEHHQLLVKNIINILKLVTEYLTIIIKSQTDLLLTVINSGSSLYNRLVVFANMTCMLAAHPNFVS